METVATFKHACIDTGMQDRTLKFRLQGKSAHYITRTTFLNSLDEQGVYDVAGMWKGEDNLEFFVSFRSESSVQLLKAVSVFDVYKDVRAVVTNPHECIQVVRFYWVPVYVSNDVFTDYLETKDLKVVTEEILKDENGLPGGVRQFKVLGTKQAISKLPHLLDFSLYNFQSLVKVPGRDPMCLRCRRLGHLRNQCPELEEARNRRAQHQQRGNTGYRGWEKPRAAKPTTEDDQVSIDSDSENDEKETNDNVKSKENNDNEDDTEQKSQEVNNEVINENDDKNENDGDENENESTEKDNEETDDEKKDDVLMKDEETLACSQKCSFDDKHANRKLRSKAKSKKGKEKQ